MQRNTGTINGAHDSEEKRGKNLPINKKNYNFVQKLYNMLYALKFFLAYYKNKITFY